jgi:hypothetical protein
MMGYWKGRALAQEEECAAARSLLCDAGTLEECEFHPGTFFDASGDLEAAYKLVNSRITSGEITLAPNQTRCNLTDLIKSVYEGTSGVESCQECARTFGPD